jgi:hypothetical protein
VPLLAVKLDRFQPDGELRNGFGPAIWKMRPLSLPMCRCNGVARGRIYRLISENLPLLWRKRHEYFDH